MAGSSGPGSASGPAMAAALALKAPLASPALTDTPTAPTAAGGTSTTQIATTAFVQGELQDLPVARVIAQSAVTLSHSGNTTETTVLTVTIPGGAMGPNGRVEVDMTWLSTPDSSVENCRVRVGGPSGAIFYEFKPGATIVSTGTSFLRVMNVNSESVQKGGATNSLGTGSGGSAGPLPPATVDTSEDWDLCFTIQNGDNTDVTALEAYIVRVVYGA